MSSLVVIERYITSLFEIAEQNRLTDIIMDDLKKIDETFKKSDDLRYFYSSKSIPASDKIDLMSKIMTGIEVNKYTQNYFQLLLQNKRFDYDAVNLSFKVYNNLYKKSLGIKQGTLYLSKIIDDKEKIELTKQIGLKLGYKLELDIKYDSSLIDGSYLEIDGMVYEDSLKMRLANLKNWMKV